MKTLKKISLKNMQDVLSENELKRIVGGSSYTSCYTKCTSTDCPADKPTCSRIGTSSDCGCFAGTLA